MDDYLWSPDNYIRISPKLAKIGIDWLEWCTITSLTDILLPKEDCFSRLMLWG